MEEGEIEDGELQDEKGKKVQFEDEQTSGKVEFKEVDKECTIREVFEGSVVYEFPTLYILIRE